MNHEAAIQQMKHHEAELLRVRVKIGIFGLHYHPSNPFLFHDFFSNPYSPFEILNFFYYTSNITYIYFYPTKAI